MSRFFDLQILEGLIETKAMGIRKYLIGVLLFVLLIWGPMDHSSPTGLLIRIAYLIIIPIIAWAILGWIWKVWNPDAITEDRLSRTLAGMTAGILLAGFILTIQSKHHLECDQYARTSDGYECVGDYVPASDPDWGRAIILIIASGFAIHVGINNKNEED